MSHSPGDLKAIFDVILDYALQLWHSQLGIVWEYEGDGYSAAALKNVPEAFQAYLLIEDRTRLLEEPGNQAS